MNYTNTDINKKFYAFAKAQLVGPSFDIQYLDQKIDNLHYIFQESRIPDCIGVVPVVNTQKTYPSIADLDVLYGNYCLQVERNVEGFVVWAEGSIAKYVRMKGGKLQPHKSR